jgi:signal transduction histidine kinase
MRFIDWKWMKGLARLLLTPRPEPTRQAERIAAMQLHIVLPARLGVIAVVLYYLYHSDWFNQPPIERTVVLETLQWFIFSIYVISNIFAGAIFAAHRGFSPGIFQWLAFTLGLLDGLFMAGLTFITGGFESIAFLIFPALILLNALSIPLATPQLVLNLLLPVFYLSAGVLDAKVPYKFALRHVPGRSSQRTPAETVPNPVAMTNAPDAAPSGEQPVRTRRRTSPWDETVRDQDLPETPTEPAMRVSLLLLLTACCYSLQVLAERQRRALEEEREFAMREAQLHSAGRLAAEFAHQIKNPLAIITNAAFTMQRALKEGRNDVSRQIETIQEEVERSDRIVTQIMGYAQLSEGRVEKLSVSEELDRAIGQVFPAAVDCGIRVERNYVLNFPPLLMQRRHVSEILVNLLQNAREILEGKGKISVSAVSRPDHSIEISVHDDGPGISADKLEKIFEAYYTTKEKGTGLGLAIVKHNVELYGGTVSVESGLGQGARFILTFPAKAMIRFARTR